MGLGIGISPYFKSSFSWSNYWAGRGFKPGADASLIVSVLNEALTNHRDVQIIEPGIYEIDNTIWIPSDTTLTWVAGCTIKKSTGSNFSHVFANKGMLTLTRNSNITFNGNGLRIEVNGIDTYSLTDTAISPVLRLRAQFQFYKVDTFIIDDWYIDDGGVNQFGLCFVDCHFGIISDISVISNKDGIDIISSSDLDFTDIYLKTGDDNFFLGIGYYSTTPYIADTERITFNDVTLEVFEGAPIGNGARMYIGSWATWLNGRSYNQNESCVNAGKVYTCATVGPTVASVAPTHSSGHITGADGIDWWWVQDGTITEANISDVTFTNLSLISNTTPAYDRNFIQFYNLCVTDGTDGNSIIDNVIFDNASIFAANTKYFLSHKGHVGTVTIKNTTFTGLTGGGLLLAGTSGGTSTFTELIFDTCVFDFTLGSFLRAADLANYSFDKFTMTDCVVTMTGRVLIQPFTDILDNCTLEFTRCTFVALQRLMATTVINITDTIILTDCEFLNSIDYVVSNTRVGCMIYVISDGTTYLDPTNYLFYSDVVGGVDINLTNSIGVITPPKVRNSTNVVITACDFDLAFETEYAAVYASFTVKPSAVDAFIQQTWLQGMVTAGYFAKAEFLDMFSTPVNTSGEALKNWKNPAAFIPAEVGTPTFEAYAGFTGREADGSSIRLNFTPSSDATLIAQNNICAIIGIGGSTGSNLYDFGANDATQFFIIAGESGNLTNFYCNEAGGGTLSITGNEIAHFAMSRSLAAGYYKYKNLEAGVYQGRVSIGLVTKELYACGRNNNDTIIGNARPIRYVFLFSYLTQAEIQGVIALTEAYLDNYGKGLIA